MAYSQGGNVANTESLNTNFLIYPYYYDLN